MIMKIFRKLCPICYRQVTDTLPTGDRQLADCRVTDVGRQLGDRLLANCRPTVGQQSADSRWCSSQIPFNVTVLCGFPITVFKNTVIGQKKKKIEHRTNRTCSHLEGIMRHTCVRSGEVVA